MDGQGLHVTAAKRQTAGKILASHQPRLWQEDAPNPCLQICYTLCPCTHAPQSAHSSPCQLTRVHYSHTRVFTPMPSFSHTWTPTAHCLFTKPSGAHSLQMHEFQILTGWAQPLQLSQAHKSRPLTRAHTSLIPCHIRAHPGGSPNVRPGPRSLWPAAEPAWRRH